MGRPRVFMKGKGSKRFKPTFKRPFGYCPKCGGAVYPTGKMKRVPAEIEANVEVSTSPVGVKKRWNYENEFKCKKCGRKWAESQIVIDLNSSWESP